MLSQTQTRVHSASWPCWRCTHLQSLNSSRLLLLLSEDDLEQALEARPPRCTS